MRYCTFCGTALEDGDVYCSKCGRKTTAQTWQIPHCSLPKSAPAEPKNKLCCELAYTGTLFWLPLIVCPGEKDARYHANQGLWLLILSVAACTGIRLLSAVNEFLLRYCTFCGTALEDGDVYRAMDIHRDEAARPILFFEKIPIIRVKKEGE